MAWSMAFFFNSFRNPLPWTNEEYEETGDSSTFFVDTYFKDDLLRSSEDLDKWGKPVPIIVISIIVSWTLVYLACFRGVKSSGKMVYVTAPLPYVLLLILFIRALTLGGAAKGLEFLFVPDWSKLGETKVWRDAVNQVIWSTALGYGPLLFYSSCRPIDSKLTRSGTAIPLINAATSLFASCVLFSYLGHIADKLDVTIEEIPINGMEMAFVAYPLLLTTLPWSNLWAVIFFGMLCTVGVDSVFGQVDYVIAMCVNAWPQILKYMRKEIFILLYCAGSCLCALSFSFENGFKLFGLWDHYAVGVALLFLVFSEAIFFGWFMGIEPLAAKVKECTGETLPKIVSFSPRFVLPLAMGLSLINAFYNDFTNPLDLSAGWLIYGWILLLAPLVISLAGLLYDTGLTGKFDKGGAQEDEKAESKA